VIGVSRDAQETVERFRASLDLPYRMVGDPSGAICKAYGVKWPVIGLARRVTYLIARDHRVRLAFHDELHADRHAGEACAIAKAVAS
jgi:thioredoxin-dependent peroxiredoxin